MLRKSLTLVVALIITFACIFPSSPTATPQENSPSQENNAETSNNNTIESTIISKDSLETVSPTDIIQEIAFFGGLGGGCGKELCECEMIEHSKPALFTSKESFEFLKVIPFQVCGLQANELATVTVEIPNQSSEIFTINSLQFIGAFSGYMMEFEFTPALSASPGSYHFTFSGNGWEFDKFINVLEPDGPRLYLDNQGFLTFYKFQPNEKVRLFVYENTKLVGWKEINAGQTGTLTLQTSIDASFIAVGENSGQVFDQDQGEYISKWAWLGSPTDIYCSGAQLPSGITPSGNVEVLVSNPPAYKYEYGTNNLTQTGTLDVEKGQILKIESNAFCHEGSFYWLVCIGNKCEYYIPEATYEHSYLRPTIKEPTDIPAAQAANNVPTCAGTLPSRLSVGVNAEVTTSGMAPQLSLRAQPSMSSEKVHVIAAGRDMVILDGPICAENSYWWYIRSEQGFEGWAREGDNEDYWIDPLP